MSNARVPREDSSGGLPLFLLTGLVIGALIGLAYAWYYSPVEYQNASPGMLSVGDRDTYRGMIALAYNADHDRGRAEARLKLLGDANPSEALALQSQHYLASGGSLEEARAMADLATVLQLPAPTLPPQQDKLGLANPQLTPAGAQLVTSAPSGRNPAQLSATPMPTFAPAPTLTPSPTPGGPFVLVGQNTVCDPKLPPGLLQVVVENGNGEPAPGVRVVVSWKDGEDFFYTGLAPEISPGYADYAMQPGLVYTLRAGDGGEPVSNLSAQPCTKPGGGSYLGGVKLRLRQ